MNDAAIIGLIFAGLYLLTQPGVLGDIPREGPIRARSSRGGTQVTIPGYASYSSIGGAQSLLINPALFGLLLNAPTRAAPAPTVAPNPYVPPDSSPASDAFWSPYDSPDELAVEP